MKRFAGSEDREFEIGGQIFQWNYPYWEDIAAVFDVDEEADANGNEPSSTVRSTIEDLISKIELFLDPDFNDGITRWRELTKRKKDPIPHSQYSELYRWLLRGHLRSAPYGSIVALGEWAAERRSYIAGRILLAGGRPQEVTLRDALDIAITLLIESYQEAGMKIDEAHKDLMSRLYPAKPGRPKTPTPEEEAASMAMLMSRMSASDFRGALG